MNENVNNQGQNFEPVDNQKKEGISKKLWKGVKCVLKIAIPLGIGAAAGYLAHDQKCKKDGTYDDAQAQREWRGRKNGNN